MERFLGSDIWTRFADKRVLDYGCGGGEEVIEVARRSGATVYGIDIQDKLLEAGRALAERECVADRCVFLNGITRAGEVAQLEESFDFAFSLDSFEHFDDPKFILERIYRLLKPGGRLLVSFGPPWKHPNGAHMGYICAFPWIHFIFAERTILEVRALYRDDGAKRFRDVEGGLNQMTIARFLELLRSSRFRIEKFRTVPIRGFELLVKNRRWGEYFTSVVLCTAVKPDVPRGA